MAVQLVSAAVIYSCDFEDPTENSQWVLNSGARGPQCESKWFIGEAGNFSVDGDSGLFVSSDSVHAVYTSGQAMYVVAYREMTLPVGSYYLDFDWRAMGKGANASINVAWVPQSVATNSNNKGSLASWANDYRICDPLYANKAWKPERVNLSVTAGNEQGKLVFVWSAAKDDPKPPSGCVDNITISNVSSCNAPQQLDYQVNRALLTWRSNATYYQVRDYCTNDGSLAFHDSITATSYNISLQSEGTHVFYVRSVCGEGVFSEWVSTSTFVWIPGKRCIDYLDIGGTPNFAGRCYTGHFEDFVSNSKGTLSQVDYGYDSHYSMHTVHTDVNEVDPITTIGGGLSVVPEGEIASVRIGARNYGSGNNDLSARIEYKYTVQAGMSDLLDLKYAVVLQTGGHEADIQPSFKLDVLDGSGNQLASSCTHLNFIPGFGETTSWHTEPPPNDNIFGSGDVYWQDWSVVTVSLRPYVGQTLTIRLTSTRCTYDTHFAYAYFTIGCRGGSLEGLACGDFATDHFTAPDGFDYRWYKEGTPQMTLGTDQTFQVDPLNADIYMVECHSKTDYSCYYVLTANPNPRFPKAEVAATQSVTACQNIVDFNNSSYIRVVNRSTGETMSEEEPIYDIFYHYGDGEEEWVEGTAHRHVYPAEGGTFECYAVASMNEGICQDTVWYTFTFEDILHTGSQDTVHSCVGDSVQLKTGPWVFRDTVYTTYSRNIYGCEAPNDHHVFFHPVSYDSTVVELCEGGYVDFEGSRYTKTGTYTVNLRTVHQCDSVLELKLTVIPRLEVRMEDTIEICADDEFIPLPYNVVKGRVSAVHVLPDSLGVVRGFLPDYPYSPDDEILIPVPEHLHPGWYRLTVTLGTPDCPSDPVDVMLKVKYSSSIVVQKNDIVALLNSDYNGGYTFSGYQWFRNDLPLIGANTSYLVVTDIDQNAKYYCMLLGDDGVMVETCPIYYTSARLALDDLTVFDVAPTVVEPGGLMTLSHGGTIRVYDAIGRLVLSEQTPVAEGPVSVTAPLQQGVYLIAAGTDAVRFIVR